MENRKKLLVIFFVLFSFCLVISGCGTSEPERTAAVRPAAPANEPQTEPQTYQEVIDETQRQMDENAEEMDVTPKGDSGGTAKSCVVLQQCGSGDDLCWQGRCWTEEQLWDEYDHCQNMKCDSLDCPECESGHEQCTIATSAGSSMYQVCVDCVRGTGCKAGFECKMGRCV